MLIFLLIIIEPILAQNTTISIENFRQPLALFSMIPSQFYVFFNSLTDGEQKEMIYLPYQMVESIEKDLNLSTETLMAPLQNITPSFRSKLTLFCDELKNTTKQINGNSKKFLANFFNTLLKIYKKLINDNNGLNDGTNIYQLGYNIIQEYLNLSTQDRLSLSKPFPTLNNLFGNPNVLEALKSITPTSTYNDYVNLKNKLKDLLLRGQLAPTINK
uniref:Fatty-acid and retinol-binding protein 1 n=1 Tax=Strongyloides stercoralis TaxID=6248 RepID=A0A0K0E520_STRER